VWSDLIVIVSVNACFELGIQLVEKHFDVQEVLQHSVELASKTNGEYRFLTA
jgi:hypothetical protein